MRSGRAVPLLLALAAGLHLAATPSHLREGLAVGAFFAIAALAQLTAAALVHRGTGPVVRAVIAAGNLGLVALWAVSRTNGLALGGHDGAPEPVALLDTLAVSAELAVVAGLVLYSPAARLVRPARWAGLPVLAVVAMLVGGIGLPFAPAAHSHDEEPAPPPAAHSHHVGAGAHDH